VKWLVYVVFASVAFAVAQSATGFSLISLHAVWALPLAGAALAVAVAAGWRGGSCRWPPPTGCGSCLR